MAEQKKGTGSAKKKTASTGKKKPAATGKKKSAAGGKKTTAAGSAKTTDSSKQKVKTEEFEATSDNLVDELKKIFREGNVRRVIVRAKDGRELLNFSLTVGLIGLIWAPLLLAVAGIVGLAKEFTIVIERRAD